MNLEAEKNKGGRPRKEVNWTEFEKLCALQATEQEIADWFEMDTNTLEARIKEKYDMRFSEVFRQKRGRGKIALRRAQWQSAIDDRNITMQIFLGKKLKILIMIISFMLHNRSFLCLAGKV